MTPKNVLVEKFQNWDDAIKERVFERNKEIRGLVIAVLARAHHLQLGPPGTAKSYLVNTALSMVENAKTMKILLHGYSLPEELYGPLSFKAMEEDRIFRKTDTYIPWADFVFADEVFKANPSLLNTNLWAFNERKFRNDGKVSTIPLISAFFASNEGPQDEDLSAFDDRIHLRFYVNRIKEDGTRLAMYRMKLQGGEAPAPVLTVEEIREANELVCQVEVPDRTLESLNELGHELSKEKIYPTDRKFNDALRIIQATAFFSGRDVATNDDLSQLAHVFWGDPTQIPAVAEKVLDMLNPIDKKANELLQDIEKLSSKVEDCITIESSSLRVRKSMTIHESLSSANQELRELRKQAKEEGVKSEVLSSTRKRLNSITIRLLEKGFGYDKDGGGMSQQELVELIKQAREETDGDG